MDKQRLLELAGVPITEGVSKDTKFYPKSISWTFGEIENQLNDYLKDYIADGEYPEGSTIVMTDEIAQQYADATAEALYDTAGERMADREIDIVEAGLKAAVKKGK
jgi:hypothetical protein